jgi:nitronate monooxygenase
VLPDLLRRGLRLPAIAAPMFLVSGPDMVIAACRAGIVGSFPANNARSIEMLEEWMVRIAAETEADGPPWAINLMVHRSYARLAEELDLVMRLKPPIVITALGSPKAVVDQIHSYGGLVLADVNSVEYARKAAAAGVDGLILVGAGAGGHTGQISGFAFVAAVREVFDGIIVLGGGIGSGRAVRAAQVLGADLAYIGTRLIASRESLAVDGYKAMLIDATVEDIVCSASLTGAPANWLKASLLTAGYDPKAMGGPAVMDLGRPEDEQAKRWRDVWSAGHGVGEVKAIEPLGDIVEGLIADYARS